MTSSRPYSSHRRAAKAQRQSDAKRSENPIASAVTYPVDSIAKELKLASLNDKLALFNFYAAKEEQELREKLSRALNQELFDEIKQLSSALKKPSPALMIEWAKDDHVRSIICHNLISTLASLKKKQIRYLPAEELPLLVEWIQRAKLRLIYPALKANNERLSLVLNEIKRFSWGKKLMGLGTTFSSERCSPKEQLNRVINDIKNLLLDETYNPEVHSIVTAFGTISLYLSATETPLAIKCAESIRIKMLEPDHKKNNQHVNKAFDEINPSDWDRTIIREYLAVRLEPWGQKWLLHTEIDTLTRLSQNKITHPGLSSVVTAFKDMLPHLPSTELRLAAECAHRIRVKLHEPDNDSNNQCLPAVLKKANKFPWGKLFMGLYIVLTLAAITTLIVLTTGATVIPMLGLSLFVKELIAYAAISSFGILAARQKFKTSQKQLSHATNAARVLFAQPPSARAKENPAESQLSNAPISPLSLRQTKAG